MASRTSAAILDDVARSCLIVDDNAEFLDAARKLLQQQGVSVVGVASNSADALALAVDLRPEVALVDVDLGSESGLDLARSLATRCEAVEVILISAYSEKDLRDLVEESPAVGFVSKSVLSRQAIDDLLDCASANPGT
jgi:DNA-binding NarL/FixJ family response regulator